MSRANINIYSTSINPQYEFQIIETVDGYEVEVETTNYNYGEDYGDYGWDNVYKHPILSKYFKPNYKSLSSAIAAVKKYRGETNVVWRETDEAIKNNTPERIIPL